MSLPSAGQFIASAVQYLIQGDEQDVALMAQVDEAIEERGGWPLDTPTIT